MCLMHSLCQFSDYWLAFITLENLTSSWNQSVVPPRFWILSLATDYTATFPTCSCVKLKHTLEISLEIVFSVKGIRLFQQTESSESIVCPVSEPNYLCLLIFCGWSIIFTLAQCVGFSVSFSSLKLLLPIHLFNSNTLSWSTYLISLDVMCAVQNHGKQSVCIFPSFVEFFYLYFETSQWFHKGILGWFWAGFFGV